MGQPQPARVALVTGASAGIGRACADRLAGGGLDGDRASAGGAPRAPDWTGPGHGRRRRRRGDSRRGRRPRPPTAGSTRWSRRPGGASPGRSSTRPERGPGPVRDQLLGLRPGRPGRPAGDARPGRRPDRADQLDRRGPRHPVPGVLQRQQVRARRLGRGARLRGRRRSASTSRWSSRATSRPTSPPAGKMAAAAEDDPVYGAALTKAVGVMERDEVNGRPADVVAATVAASAGGPAPAAAGLVRQGRRAGQACSPSACCRTASSRPAPRAAWASADAPTRPTSPKPNVTMLRRLTT